MEILRKNTPPLYTNEMTVFRSGLENADPSRPITVFVDPCGNQAVADGNHRAFVAHISDALPELHRRIIGRIPRDISMDPNYRKIAELKFLNK